MKPPTSKQLDTFARVLGDEIRTVRKARRWTRKQLRAQLNPDEEVSLQTLATYELGTRRMTVERLIEICAALDHPPDQLLQRARARAFAEPDDDRIEVDLSALARTADPQLEPLQRWAVLRAAQRTDGKPATETLEPPALAALANLAGVTTQRLASALHELRPAAS
jgi:transcriptional regulator with XRE-family HTH domain